MDKDRLLVQQDRIIEEYQLSPKYTKHGLNVITRVILHHEAELQNSIRRIDEFYNSNPDSFVWRFMSHRGGSYFELIAHGKDPEDVFKYAKISSGRSGFLEGMDASVTVYSGPFYDQNECLGLYYMLPYSEANNAIELERFRKAVIEKLIEIGISMNPESINSDVFG